MKRFPCCCTCSACGGGDPKIKLSPNFCKILMLPFLYGLLFFLLQLSIVLITHHPQPFSDSKMIMNRFRIFEKSPTSLLLIYESIVDIPLTSPHFTSLSHSRNMSVITSDTYFVNKILRQIPLKSISFKRLKSTVCNQSSYNTMKNPCIHTGISALYGVYITSTDAKKNQFWTYIITNNYSINISSTKFKKLENPIITTLTTYWDPTPLLSTAKMLNGQETNKPHKTIKLNPHIHISPLLPDQNLSKAVSILGTLTSNFSPRHGIVTSMLLKKNQNLSHEHTIGNSSSIFPKVSNKLLNLLEDTRNTSLNHSIILFSTETRIIIKDPKNLTDCTTLHSPWSTIRYISRKCKGRLNKTTKLYDNTPTSLAAYGFNVEGLPLKLENYHYLSTESQQYGNAALMVRFRLINRLTLTVHGLQTMPVIRGCIIYMTSFCYNMMISCCFGKIIKFTYVIYLLLLLYFLVRIKLSPTSDTLMHSLFHSIKT